jgi:methionyl-tRNA formyltransferase
LQPGPVKVLAAAKDIEVLQPATLRDPLAASELARFGLDVLIVVAYGLLLPSAILETPRLGCINVHASLLPRWRGAAPVERAIMAGDDTTGVSIMRMDRGLDTGPIYLTRSCPIHERATGPELEATLAELGQDALLQCLAELPDLKPVPQPSDGVCYAHKLSTADALIDWSCDARSIDRQVRALCGRLPAFTFAGETRVQILAAIPDARTTADAPPGTVVDASPKTGITVACGDGALIITRLQLNRGKGLPMGAADALNGFQDLVGMGRVLRGQTG